MSKTFKISNGDRDIDPATGLQRMVSDREKVSQDIANCLMVTYDPDSDFGSEIMDIISLPVSAANGILMTKVSDAINRLITQSKSDPAFSSVEAIEVVNINVTKDESQVSTYWFYLECRIEGKTIEKAMLVKIGPTKLSHQLPSSVAKMIGVTNG